MLSKSRPQRDGNATEVGAGGDDATTGKAERRASSLLVDCTCPRTGLTPLLKAVEGGSEDVVRVLLDAGGDVESQVRDEAWLR